MDEISFSDGRFNFIVSDDEGNLLNGTFHKKTNFPNNKIKSQKTNRTNN